MSATVKRIPKRIPKRITSTELKQQVNNDLFDDVEHVNDNDVNSFSKHKLKILRGKKKSQCESSIKTVEKLTKYSPKLLEKPKKVTPVWMPPSKIQPAPIKAKNINNSDVKVLSLSNKEDQIPFGIDNDSLPLGYEVDSKGRICKTSGRKKDQLLPIANKPFRIVASASDHNENDCSHIIQFPDRNGNAREVTLKDEDWLDKNRICEKLLMNKGLKIASKKLFDEFVSDSEIPDHKLIVNQLGWIREQNEMIYITPNEIIGRTGLKNIIHNFNSSEESSVREKCGSLADWQNNTLQHAAKFPPALLSILIAFASTIASFLKVSSGGYHLYGMSSGGKSSSLKAAATVFGCASNSGGRSSFVQDWLVTANALDPMLASRCNNLLPLDELGMFSGSLSDVIYKIETGKGKKRSNVSGGLQKILQWNSTVVSAGEISIKETLDKQKQYKEGTRVRILDINFDRLLQDMGGSKDNDFFASLNEYCESYYGTAGLEFIKALIGEYRTYDNVEIELKREFQSCCEELVGDSEFSNFKMRGIQRFALVYLAGKLSHSFGILKPVTLESIKRVVESAMSVWINSKDLASEGELGAEKLAAYLRMNAHVMKNSIISHFGGGSVVTGYIYQNQFYVDPEAMKQILGSYNLKKTMHYLNEKGYLITADDGRFQLRRTLPGSANKRYYYVISPDLCEASFEG